MVDKPDTSSKEREPEEEPSQAPGDEITTVQEPAPILNGEAGNRSETPPNKKGDFPQPTPRQRRRDLHKDVTTIAASLTAVVLILQWLTLRETTELSRKVQRAWVGPLAVSAPSISLDSKYVTSVILENSGNTPALEVEVLASYNIQPPSEDFKPIYREKEPTPPSRFTINPGSRPNVPIPVDPQHPVTSEWTKAIIEDQTMVLYVYGIITYETTFSDDPRTTTFGFRYVPSLSVWRYTDTYNTAD